MYQHTEFNKMTKLIDTNLNATASFLSSWPFFANKRVLYAFSRLSVIGRPCMFFGVQFNVFVCKSLIVCLSWH